jgi:hypothetical protein
MVIAAGGWRIAGERLEIGIRSSLENLARFTEPFQG